MTAPTLRPADAPGPGRPRPAGTDPRPPRSDDAVPLGDRLRTVRRAWWLVAGGALVGGVLGVQVVLAHPPLHRASVSVLVADAPVALSGADNPVTKRFTMDTEAARVRSAPVQGAVALALGDGAVPDGLSVAAVPNTKTLTISYRGRSDADAVRGATVAADAYLEVRSQALARRREARVSATEGEIADLTRRLDGTGLDRDPGARAAVRAQRRTLIRQIASARSTVITVGNASVYPGQVLRKAEVAPATRRNPTVPPAGGIVVGGLLGLVVARLRPRRITVVDDLRRALPGTMATEVATPAPPAVLDVVATWMVADPVPGPKVLLVTAVDARSRWAAGDIANGLRTALSGAGRRAVLLDAHRADDIPSERLDYEGRPLDLARDDRVTATAVRSLVAEDASVVVDASRVPEGLDRVVAAISDAVALVVAKGTPEARLREVTERLHRSGGRVDVVLLVRRHARRRRSPASGGVV